RSTTRPASASGCSALAPAHEMHIRAGDHAVDHRVGALIELDGAVGLLGFQFGGDDVAVNVDDGDGVMLGASESGLELRERPILASELPGGWERMRVEVGEVPAHARVRFGWATRWSGLGGWGGRRRAMAVMRQLVRDPAEPCQDDEYD